MQQGPNHVTQREYQVDDDQFASEFLIPDEFRNIRQSKPGWNEFAQTIDAGAGQNMLQIVVLDLPKLEEFVLTLRRRPLIFDDLYFVAADKLGKQHAS